MTKKFIFLNVLYSLLATAVILVTTYVFVLMFMLHFDETPMEHTLGVVYSYILIGAFPVSFALVWFFRSKFAKVMPQDVVN